LKYNKSNEISNSWIVGFLQGIMLGSLLAIFAFIGTSISHAQDREHNHGQKHDFYKDWKRPTEEGSCCNLREVNQYGNVSGDCYATQAELRPSAKPYLKDKMVWWAWRKYGKAPDGGVFVPRWIEINDRYLIREKNPDESGRDAHLCQPDNFTDENVYCFKEPVGAL
jgi:MFS superfamily sulfate permease-like transporter